MTDSYVGFLNAGDEYLVAFASAPLLAGVSPFLLGHAVELYLKGAWAAEYGGDKTVVEIIDELKKKYGHNLILIWKDLKKNPTFMPSLEIREHLLAKDYFGKDAAEIGYLSIDDQVHLRKFQELYLIFRHQAQLKYMYLPFFPDNLSFGTADAWVSFFVEIRKFIGYPARPGEDRLAFLIDNGDVRGYAAEVLSRITGQRVAKPS